MTASLSWRTLSEFFSPCCRQRGIRNRSVLMQPRRSEQVGEGGLEPPPRCRDRNLNPARLPDFATRPWVRNGNNRPGRRSRDERLACEPPEHPSVPVHIQLP